MLLWFQIHDGNIKGIRGENYTPGQSYVPIRREQTEVFIVKKALKKDMALPNINDSGWKIVTNANRKPRTRGGGMVIWQWYRGKSRSYT